VFYNRHVEDAFGAEVDFAQLIKLYGQYGQHEADAKYSPPPIVGQVVAIGPSYATTPHAEPRFRLRSENEWMNGLNAGSDLSPTQGVARSRLSVANAKPALSMQVRSD
jgi:hypothetical protein